MEAKKMDAASILEEVQAKAAKSKQSRLLALGALKELVANADIKLAATYLLKLHHSVCALFFAELCGWATEEQLIAVCEAFVADELFSQGKAHLVMYPKGLAAVIALASKEKKPQAIKILEQILPVAHGKKGFADSFANSLKKQATEAGATGILASMLGEESDNNQLFAQLKLLVDDMSSPTQTPESLEAGGISRIESAQQEILGILKSFQASLQNIDILAPTSTGQEVHVQEDASSLASKLENADKQLSEANLQISELTERLRASLHMDRVASSQEASTLRTDISEALKIEYADFNSSIDDDYDEDLFEAYRSTIARIFKLLRRFGIPCQ